MVRRIVLSATLAAAVAFCLSAANADEEKPTSHVRVHRHVETRAPVRLHYRYVYRSAGFHRRHYFGYRHQHHYGFAYRAWDGRYGSYPRRHFFVDGVYTNGFYGPVNYGFVTYRTFVYYTPTYPSMTFDYPPYAHVYGLTPGPVYNKPCLC